MIASYQKGLVHLQEADWMPFKNITVPVEEMKQSILWQLKELENTEQFPFIKNIICSRYFDEFVCMINRDCLDRQSYVQEFQELVASSGYYNAFLGKAAADIYVTIYLVDFTTEEIYETIQYPSM